MFGMWDVRDVRCSGCAMLGMWHVRDVGCSGGGMFGMWDVRDVGCSGCGMFGMWNVRDVGCGMFAGMWNVDLQNATYINYDSCFSYCLVLFVPNYCINHLLESATPYFY